MIYPTKHDLNGGKGGPESQGPIGPARDTSRDGSAELAMRTRLAAERLEANGSVLGQTVEQIEGAKKALAFLNSMADGSARDEAGRGPSLRDRRRSAESVLQHTRAVTAMTPGDEKALEVASTVQSGQMDVMVELGELLPTTKVYDLGDGEAAPKTNGKHKEV